MTATKFPGTEMEVFEKYPDSRRLDFPNFGDVCKTTFAKGVISDFKVDDPDDMLGTIHSQVKVTGDWGESEFIPIFFNPKKQYWDDEEVKATDFDQEEVEFKRAWMSFRGMDEVAVMLKEGVPVAVMGFADGVPRIGENIIYVEGHKEKWANFLKGGEYEQQDIGPDGLALGLKLPSKQLETKSKSNKHGPFWAWVGGSEQYSVEFVSTPPFMYGFTFSEWDWTNKNKFVAHTFSVGPFIFIVQILSTTTVHKGISLQMIFASSNYGGNDVPVPYQYASDFLVADHNEVLKPGINPMGWGGIITDGPYNSRVNGTPDVSFKVLWALYNENTKDPIVSQPGSLDLSVEDWFNHYEDFKDCSLDTSFIFAATGIPDGYTGEPDLEFMVRPHTKEELQTAGMWPAGV